MVCTHNKPSKKAVKQAVNRVTALNLDRITRKVQEKQGWDAERAGQAELQYRQYLVLILLYPGQPIAPPSKDADEIWHGHILDTLAYHQDCQLLFGDYLHHAPSYGTQGEKLTMAWAKERTATLFDRHFGQQADSTGLNRNNAFWVTLGERLSKKSTTEAECTEAGNAATAIEETAFCICMVGPAARNRATGPHANQAPQANEAQHKEPGCVPCLGQRERRHGSGLQQDQQPGCVPCLGQRGRRNKEAIAVG